VRTEEEIARLRAMARLELARRGDPRWAPLLQRCEEPKGRGEWRTDLPREKALKQFVRALSREGLEALRELFEAVYA